MLIAQKKDKKNEARHIIEFNYSSSAEMMKKNSRDERYNEKDFFG